MSFDNLYNNILHKSIISQNWIDDTIDWTSGKVKKISNWTEQKFQEVSNALFSKATSDNIQQEKQIATSIAKSLPEENRKQLIHVKNILQSEQFQKYYKTELAKIYTQEQIKKLSDQELKNNYLKIAQKYFKQNQNLISEGWALVGPALIKCIPFLIKTAATIGATWAVTKGVQKVTDKVDKTFTISDTAKAKDKANATEIQRQSKINSAKTQLELSNLQQQKLNIALAN